MAITGCGCGFIAMLGILLTFLLLMLRAEEARRYPERDPRAVKACQDAMRDLYGATRRYTLDHGRLPAALDDLTPTYLETAAPVRCPRGGHPAYSYTPKAAHPADPLITCTNHGQKTLILQHDGRLRVP
jgi:hypothetical protein